MFSDKKLLYPDTPRVVCIAVDNGEEPLLIPTLQSVVTNTLIETDIVVFADRQAAELPLAERQNRSIQWVGTVNTGLPYAVLEFMLTHYTGHDLLFVRPGVQVPYGWDARLALAAAQDERIAAVSPMCDVSPLFALLDDPGAYPAELTTIDRLVYAMGQRRSIELPAILCSCVYLRYTAIRMIWPSFNDAAELGLSLFFRTLAQTFSLSGLHNVCCDHVYVVDDNSEHRRMMADIMGQEDVQLINRAHPLTGLRWIVKEKLTRSSCPLIEGTYRKPVQLHVAHSWGGGLGRWVQDYCENDTQRTNLVLRSIGTWGAFGQRIALYPSHRMDTPLCYWDLEYPIRSTAITHLQYKTILSEVIDKCGVEVILVSSLIGHSLDLLDTSVKTIFVTHDYYPFCPAIYIFFDGVCTQCSTDRLRQCFFENAQNRFFKNMTAEEWMAIRRHFIELACKHHTLFVSPSESVPRYLKALIPELQDKDFKIIEHGINFASPKADDKRHGVRNSDKLRLVVLGNLALQKGGKLLEEAYPELCKIADLYLIGCGEELGFLKKKKDIYRIPHYERDKLPGIINQIDPDAGLLLSIWPETFSYTLSELWILGIPPIATSIGSFADRIVDGVDGFLCQPTPDAVIEKVKWVAKHRATLDRVRQELSGRQYRTVEAMVAEYQALTPLPEFWSQRYFLGYSNMPQVDRGQSSVLTIDPQVRFSVVIGEFSQYVLQKLAVTPRLVPWQKKLLTNLVRAGLWVAHSVTGRRWAHLARSNRE